MAQDGDNSQALTKFRPGSPTRATVQTQIEQYLKDIQFLVRSGHTAEVSSVVFSPDGELVASGSNDRTVKLWGVRTGRLLRSLEGHTNGITSVIFSPDGERVVSGSADGTIKIWSPGTGCLLVTFLATSKHKWISYTPEGYFVGSEAVEEKVMMKFRRGE